MFKFSKYSLGAKLGAMMIVVGLVLLLIPVYHLSANTCNYPRNFSLLAGMDQTNVGTVQIDTYQPDPDTGVEYLLVKFVISDNVSGSMHVDISSTVPANRGVPGHYNMNIYGNGSEFLIPLSELDDLSDSSSGGGSSWFNYITACDPRNNNNIYIRAHAEVNSDTAFGGSYVPETSSITVEKSGLEAGDSADFTIVGPEDYDVSFTLPDNGSLSWSDSDLVYGEYTITENTPAGYEDPVFTLNGAAQAPGNTATFTIGEEGDAALTYIINVENILTTPETGSIVINKITLGGLTGTFIFTAINNETDEEFTTEITITDGNNSGQATISDLEPGSYTVTEAEGDFITTVDVTDGEVTVVAGESEAVTFVNSPEDEETGAITINKITTDGLTGTFIFTAINGDNSFETSITINEDEDSGQATITDLEPGNYTVTEAEPSVSI